MDVPSLPRSSNNLRVPVKNPFPGHCAAICLSTCGFSLTEILVVVAILGLLTTLAVPVTSSLLGGRGLSASTQRVWAVVSAARQEAISRNAIVVLVAATGRNEAETGDYGDREKSDAVILLAANRSPGSLTWQWTPISRWNNLPRGISTAVSDASLFRSVDVSGQDSAFAAIAPALPRIDGEPVGDFYFLAFRPDGSVQAPSSTPALEFRRLRPRPDVAEAVLTINPETGRPRLF
jgi:prepilin-type N-terminal cleavage/methylation domain-containing protein